MPRPSASDIELQFLGGLMTVTVDWMPISEKKRATAFKTICPDCPTETSLGQFYICDSPDHGPYKAGEMAKAVEVSKGTLRRVTPEEIAAIKVAELPLKVLACDVYAADDFMSKTRPVGSVWHGAPTQNPGLVRLVTDLVSDPTRAYAGEVNLGAKLGQKFVRVVSAYGGLEFVEHARPEEVLVAAPVEASYDAGLLAKAVKFCDGLVEPFDPTKFANKVRQRAEEFTAALAGGTVIAAKPAPTQNAEVDLMAALDAALAGMSA